MTIFSVLICTYHRPDMLEKALETLINKTDEKPDQVIVVNGGDERITPIVRKYMDLQGIKVELVKTININLATSRNIGLVRCTGDIVAMTDDDAEVFPDWVTQMKRVHAEHPEAGGVGGAVLGVDSDKSLLSRIADIAVFPSPALTEYVRTLPGVNVSYKKEVLQQVGWQDETLFRGEDVDFNWRIKRLGYEIFYDPTIKVLHNHRPNLRQFINQFYMYGRAYYLVRRKWPDMYCVYPHHFARAKDILKMINFFGNICYLPFLFAWRMPKWVDKIRAVPILFCTELAWKFGVVWQKWLTFRT